MMITRPWIRSSSQLARATSRPPCSLLLVAHPTQQHISVATTVTEPKHSRKRQNDPTYKFRDLVPAVHAFYQVKRHFAIPFNFRIPSDPEWTEDVQGINVSRLLARFLRIAYRRDCQPLVDELLNLGFPLERHEFSTEGWKQLQWEQITVAGLETYQRLHGHLLVPQQFIVPEGDSQWPRATWGVSLGNMVNRLRTHRAKLPAYQVEYLNEIGFHWNAWDTKWNHYFLPALRRYRELYGHCNVPQSFTVPTCEQDELKQWPPHLHGYTLGTTIMAVRVGKYQNHVDTSRDELDELGFSFDAVETMWNEIVLPALTVYSQLHQLCSVPTRFIVPSEAPWPEKAWGHTLGHTVSGIRNKLYPCFADQVKRDAAILDKIGFVWNLPDSKWKHLVLPALRHYHHLYGHSDVKRDFVVPRGKESQWPERLHGLHLGYIVTRIANGHYQEQALESWKELEEIGFVNSAAVA